jgi:hypothetical protein
VLGATGTTLGGQVPMFRPLPGNGHDRIWHVLDRRLNGFALVAPFPCGFVQAEILSEQTATSRDRLVTGDVTEVERRVCRHCLGAIRRGAAA